MRRGDLISVALVRDYGKPRPAIIIQSDEFQHLDSVTVVPLTSDRVRQEVFRVQLEPSEENGLREKSHVMVDKMATLPRAKAEHYIGHVSDEEMALVDRALAAFLGFA
ncbi:MAG: transcriptional modulator of MazE/toxin, MazF [Tardiphaga sp.]|jgi:mRNA interferase MazF|nr:transcriptional modulator of MazE/toxin, MazF [Tardiphaga sp.]